MMAFLRNLYEGAKIITSTTILGALAGFTWILSFSMHCMRISSPPVNVTFSDGNVNITRLLDCYEKHLNHCHTPLEINVNTHHMIHTEDCATEVATWTMAGFAVGAAICLAWGAYRSCQGCQSTKIKDRDVYAQMETGERCRFTPLNSTVQ